MSWQLHIRDEALTDIETAADWYEEQQLDLGQEQSALVLASPVSKSDLLPRAE